MTDEEAKAVAVFLKLIVFPVIGFVAGFFMKWFLQSRKSHDELLRELSRSLLKLAESDGSASYPQVHGRAGDMEIAAPARRSILDHLWSARFRGGAPLSLTRRPPRSS
jgi:hypothetical protein